MHLILNIYVNENYLLKRVYVLLIIFFFFSLADISKSREEPPVQPMMNIYPRTLMGDREEELQGQPGTISTPGLNIPNYQTLCFVMPAGILALLKPQNRI